MKYCSRLHVSSAASCPTRVRSDLRSPITDVPAYKSGANDIHCKAYVVNVSRLRASNRLLTLNDYTSLSRFYGNTRLENIWRDVTAKDVKKFEWRSRVSSVAHQKMILWILILYCHRRIRFEERRGERHPVAIHCAAYCDIPPALGKYTRVAVWTISVIYRFRVNCFFFWKSTDIVFVLKYTVNSKNNHQSYFVLDTLL